MPAQAPLPKVVDVDLDEAALLDPAGDAVGQRPLEHPREQRQDLDLEHQSGGSAGADGDASVALAEDSTGPDDAAVAARGRCRPTRASAPGSFRLWHLKLEGVGIDDDLAASRRKDPDERPYGRQVELAEGPTADEEHLGAAGPVHVLDAAELAALGVEHGRADHLVPVVLASWQLLAGRDLDLEIGVAKPVGSCAVEDLVEADEPAGFVRMRGGNGQRFVRPLAKSRAPRRNRSSGRSVRISTRTAPRRPWMPRTCPTARRSPTLNGRLARRRLRGSPATPPRRRVPPSP